MGGEILKLPNVTASLSLYTNEGGYKRRARNAGFGPKKVAQSSTPRGTREDLREGR